MAMNEVGSAYVSIYPNTSKFSKELEKSIGNITLKNTALGNIFGNAFSSLTDTIVGSLDKGIKRFDTIQNFPKLMQTFGYSAEEAANSVELIANHLDGLPGSTDEVLSLVQALSDSTSSLSLATTTGVAFNDMLTASGADAATTTMAMRTFDQIMGGGAITTMRWQSLVSKMPKQFNMLAEEILGAGNSSVELGEALQKGEVSLEELAQGMTTLGPEFENQARAMSAGVGTALENIPNRVAKGWEEIMKVIGQENISGVINDFGYGIRDAMTGAAQALEQFKNDNSGILTQIGSQFSQIVEKIKGAWDSIDWSGAKQLASDFLQGLSGALQWILDNGDIVSSVLTGVAVALGGIWLAGKFTQLFDIIMKIVGLIAANPLAAIVIVIGAIVAALKHFFTETETGREMWANFTKFLGEKIEQIKTFFENFKQKAGEVFDKYLRPIIEGAKEKFNSIKDAVSKAVTNAVTKFNELRTKVKDVFDKIKSVTQAAWKGISDFISDPIGTAKRAVENVINGIKTFLSNIFGGMKSDTKTKWQGISDVIMAPVNALKGLLEPVFNGIKSFVSGIFGDVKNDSKSKWDSISSTVVGIAGGLKDKVSTKLGELKDKAKGIWDGMKNTAGSIWDGIKGVISNAIGGAKSSVDNNVNSMQNKLNSIKGKNVTVGVQKANSFDGVVRSAQKSINGVVGKTAYIKLHAYQTGIRGVDVNTSSTSNGLRVRVNPVQMTMARGGILLDATTILAGEAGHEAVVPLSNRRYVRPFAQAVAAEIPYGGASGVDIHDNTFIIRKESDIDLVANRLNTLISRERAGAL